MNKRKTVRNVLILFACILAAVAIGYTALTNSGTCRTCCPPHHDGPE